MERNIFSRQFLLNSDGSQRLLSSETESSSSQFKKAWSSLGKSLVRVDHSLLATSSACQVASSGWALKSLASEILPSWWENLSHERLINHQGLYFRILGALGTVCICPGFWTELGIWLSRTLTFWAFILNRHESSHQILKSSRSWNYLFPPSSNYYCLQISLQPDIPHSVSFSRQELWLKRICRYYLCYCVISVTERYGCPAP